SLAAPSRHYPRTLRRHRTTPTRRPSGQARARRRGDLAVGRRAARQFFLGSSFGFAAGPVGAPAAGGASFTISSSSTSNVSVEPGLIFGGAPRSPYATSEGHTSFAFPPGFI